VAVTQLVGLCDISGTLGCRGVCFWLVGLLLFTDGRIILSCMCGVLSPLHLGWWCVVGCGVTRLIRLAVGCWCVAGDCSRWCLGVGVGCW